MPLTKPSIFNFLIILFLCVVTNGLHAQQTFRFEHINQNKGLSQGTVNVIYEDQDGLMWFGTKDGLNRWDGKKMLVFRQNHLKKESLPNNHILSILEDQQNRLWIGSMGGGLFYQDAIKSGFHHWHTVLKKPFNDNSIGENIYCLQYDTSSSILYAGSNKGVAIINLELGTYEFINLEDYRVQDIFVKEIISLLPDGNNLWIGTNKGGLIRYSFSDQTLMPFPILHDRLNRNPADNLGTIMDIKKDRSGKIWVATFGDYLLTVDTLKNGLAETGFDIKDHESGRVFYMKAITLVGDTSIWAVTDYGFQIFNVLTNSLTVYRYNPQDVKGISSNSLKTIYNDRNGGVWIGDNGFGLNYYFPGNKPFRNILPNIGSSSGLTFKSVRSIYRDEEGYLFIGGYGNLNKFDPNGKRLWETDRVATAYVIHPDPVDKGVLWIGHEGGKLRKIRKSDGSALKLYVMNQPGEAGYIYGENVYAIMDKTDDELWIGTEYGINILDKRTDKTRFFGHVKSDSTSLPDGYIKVLYTDNQKRIWVGSIGGGLALSTDNFMQFKRFEHHPSKPGSISSNIVYSVHQSKAGNIYIGTENGLNIYNEQRGNFNHLNTSDGLANDVIYGIVEDNNGQIWLSTNQGLSCYNPTTNSFRNYDKADGLQENEFNSNAHFRQQDGTLYFGGINGVSYFNPNELKDNTLKPKIIFTQLKIGNQIAAFPITRTSEIAIDYNNQSLSLEFAALNYYQSEKNQFAYRIQELQKEFTFLGNNNSIEIAHLGYGEFTLQVMASNNDNYWNNTPINLLIKIPPPFWAQLWFRIALVLGFLLVTTAIFLYRIRSSEKKRKLLEQLVDQRTLALKIANEELKQEIGVRKKAEAELLLANITKDKFFSIIAHDLRSPFNALLGMSKILDEDFDIINPKERKDITASISQGMYGFYKLLENLLTWARQQTGKIHIEPKKTDLKFIVDENLNLLILQAANKQITLTSNISEPIYIWADEDAVHVIIRNLLNNAIKFTYQGGAVSISVSKNQDQIVLSIKDDGIGISPENIEKLFRIDEQFKQPGTNNETGTGLGLVLCKDFAEANKGTLKVESKIGEGSTFILSLPAYKEK